MPTWNMFAYDYDNGDTTFSNTLRAKAKPPESSYSHI